MSSSESPATDSSELILKTETYDIDGTTNQLQPSVFLKSITSVPTVNKTTATHQFGIVNLNNKTRADYNQTDKSRCDLSSSPKLKTSFYANQPPIDKMPIPTSSEVQLTTMTATTPRQHSISPSLPLQPTSTPATATQASLQSSPSPSEQLLNTPRMTSILGGYGLVPSSILGPLDHYRLQLYSYAMNVERLRGCGASQQYSPPIYPSGYPGGCVGNGPYAPTRFALSMGLFPNRMFQPEEPKPQHSYIGLIAMAILSSAEAKLVLSDIYQHILDNYPYFRTRGPGWRNSIRHNLSLNDCFIKAGRSANGKGHYWAIHPANMDDFRKGDFRRRKAQRKVRKHMGLAVDDEGTDSPSPPPLAVTPPPIVPPTHSDVLLVGSPYGNTRHHNHQHYASSLSSVIITNSSNTEGNSGTNTPTAAGVIANFYSQTRKRQFDVASLLAPDNIPEHNHHSHRLPLITKQCITLTEDEDIDVVASDVDIDDDESYHNCESNSIYHNEHHYEQHQQQPELTHLTYSSSPHSNSYNRYYKAPSPVNQQESASSDLPGAQTTNNNTNNLNFAASNWQGLMQHCPNEFGTAAAATIDPRIFGRYYSQYMAAAAARRVVRVFPAAAAAAAAAVIGHQNATTAKQHQQSPTLASQKQQQQQQQSYGC